MPTAGISLVREHTERIRPPRALWVPFELGRPLGPPNQPEFQIAVLRALLGLFAQAAGPVIEDYGVEAPASSDGDEPWSCVLPLPPLPAAASPTERREQVLQAEVGFLAPWYGEAVQRKGRTAYGLSGIEAERSPELADFIAAWASGESPEPAGRRRRPHAGGAALDRRRPEVVLPGSGRRPARQERDHRLRDEPLALPRHALR